MGLRVPSVKWARLVGLGLISTGVLLVAASASYYFYSVKARADLDRLVVNPSGAELIEEPTDLLPPLSSREAEFPTEFSIADAVAPAPFDSPRTLASDPQSESPGFRLVDWDSLARTLGETPRATRIAIPAIGLDSPVVDVAIVEDGGKRVWQRPKNSVGYHQGTVHPGEVGNTVMSGHISSPVRGEGSIFRRLPEVAKLLDAGQPVDIYVYTEDKTYVYRVVGTNVVKPGDIRVFARSERPTLSLITCVPDRVYSHRLIVSALLVQEADGGAAPVSQVVEGRVVVPDG